MGRPEGNQRAYNAVFMRGGTSKGVFFRHDELPDDLAARNEIFVHAIGSPDPYGRQLNGMGGGVSSLSKAVIVGPSTKDGADVDYTFAQVLIEAPEVDYSATCGNLSSAIGPFAVDQGLVAPKDGEQTVRVHNTNTGKIYHATFSVSQGAFDPFGDFEIPGVGGTGSKIRLDYLDPGGATTGQLLPSGNVIDVLEVLGIGEVKVSAIDASNAVVFLDAARLGKTATENVSELESDTEFMDALERIRCAAGVVMGLASTPEDVPPGNPKIGIVSAPARSTSLDGSSLVPDDMDITARIVSMGQVHRALPLTGSMCLGVACRIPGTITHQICRPQAGDIRIANPSGIIPVDADVSAEGDTVIAKSCTVYRTARPLMAGQVLVPHP